ncbi:MAG: VOC family protein [Anaerolineaceae bacterium]|nr:VOC family protein [Anaerolineaceae bacterium]
MSKMNLYANFNGQCREAMTFYKSVFGGELSMQSAGSSPMATQVPAQFQDHLIHAQLDTKDWTLMASDAIGHPLTHGNDMSIMINCDNEEQINAYYTALSAGGEIVSELKKEFWGAIYANFVDKFGIRWMLNYAQN